MLKMIEMGKNNKLWLKTKLKLKKYKWIVKWVWQQTQNHES